MWLTSQLCEDPSKGDKTLRFTGDSDAHIVRGLMAIVFGIFSQKTPREILDTDYQSIFDTLDLKDHISPQRSNGLNAMVQRIKSEAQTVLQAQ